ncbi:MAG: DUF4388 domain-containing protein [Thermoanaerobaculia bacterium]|nr:DUF4388 domain-containing protein [Thermoanaerobaculia bacterium]
MSFVGELSKFHLPDLLQMIATAGKTGKLSLTRRDCKGVIVFRGGKITYAAATTLPRETLGSALIGEGVLAPADLRRAVTLQRSSEDDRRLGEVLIAEGMVSAEDLERVIQQQVEKVIAEFLEWHEGFFRFELLDLPEGEEIEVDAGDFLLDQGLGAEHVLLSIAVHLDELEKEREEEGGSGKAGGPATTVAPEESMDARLRSHSLTDLTSLKAMMTEVRSPEFTGEMSSQVLDFARGRFRRGVLFTVGARQFHGIGGFGPEEKGGPGPLAAREIVVPAGQPSVLREVLERGETYCGELPFLPMNEKLVEQLGKGRPSEVAVLPLIVNGRVLLLFYADNVPGDAPIGSLAEMELLLLQVGLAMEKGLLADRVRELEMMQHLLRQA